MEFMEIMTLLQDEMKVGVLATSDAQGNPHARHAFVAVANEKGLFFSTAPTSSLYHHLGVNDHLAIAAISQANDLIQTIRVEGQAKEIDQAGLEALMPGHPFIDFVYSENSPHPGGRAFHMYQGKGTYESMTQGIKIPFHFQDGQGHIDA